MRELLLVIRRLAVQSLQHGNKDKAHASFFSALPFSNKWYKKENSNLAMRNIQTSKTYVIFNTRDEIIKVKLDRVAYFEADSNYCQVVFINGIKATLLASLSNIEELLTEYSSDDKPIFIRIGKRYIVNRNFIFQFNILRQKLVLSDYISPIVLEISISKEALKNLKKLYDNK